jgi:rod shape-determining protein MreC
MVYKFNLRLLLITIAALSMIFLSSSRIVYTTQSILDATASVITYPFLKLQQSIANVLENIFARKKNVQELQALVEKLEHERQRLLEDNIAFQSQLDFIEETQELVQFQKRYKNYRKHLCQILLRQYSDKGHFFIIDAGSRHGIEPDMIAVYKNCLIGKITEVFPLYSKITLITDQNFKIAAFCSQTKTKGIFEGINQLDYAALNHVSHLEKIQKNELVISSGEGLIFPRGFGLGRVCYFTSDGVDFTIRLEPLIDLKNLVYCYVMKKGDT